MEENKQIKYYRIGEISKICNIPIRTLHHYDDVNLLKPAKVDSINNYRYYSHNQILDINTIKYFKMAGCSLSEIKKLIERDHLEYSKTIIRSKSVEIEAKIISLTSLKDKLNLYIEEMSEDSLGKSSDIHIKEIPLSYVAYSRYTGPCNKNESYLRFTKLTNIVEKNNLQMIGTMMSIYHDDYGEFDYMKADIEVCVKIANSSEELQSVRKYGGFLGAVTYHYGSYSTMSNTYSRMMKWLNKNGLEFLGEAVENYIIDAITTSCEDEYITEIILPVQQMK